MSELRNSKEKIKLNKTKYDEDEKDALVFNLKSYTDSRRISALQHQRPSTAIRRASASGTNHSANKESPIREFEKKMEK